MNKMYNTQKNIASDLAKFFKKVSSNLSKPQLKIIPYIILGMIESESVVTTDIVKKLKGSFPLLTLLLLCEGLNDFLTIPNLTFIISMIILFQMLFLTIILKVRKYMYQ